MDSSQPPWCSLPMAVMPICLETMAQRMTCQRRMGRALSCGHVAERGCGGAPPERGWRILSTWPEISRRATPWTALPYSTIAQYVCAWRMLVCVFLSLLAKYPLKSPSFPCWSKLFFLWHYTYTQTFLALINIIITIITMCVLLTDDLTNQWVYRIIKMTCPTLVTRVPTDVLKNTIYPSVKHCIWKTLYTICSAPNTVLHSASEVPDIFLWRW